MNTHHCCQIKTRGCDSARRPASRLRRSGAIGGWIVPGAILALMPKCPACLAAYVAVGTGVGLSLSTATHLRTALLILSIASLVYLVATRLGRFVVVKRALLRAKWHLPMIRTKETAPCKRPTWDSQES